MRLMLWTFFLGSCCFGLYASDQDLSKEIKTISRGEIYTGDYFAASSDIEIAGVVTGDAYLLSGKAYIEGRIEGDLIVASGSVDISGEVMGNVRILAGQVSLSGTVHRSVTIAAASIILMPTARIEGSLLAASGNLDLSAFVGKGAKLFSSSIRLAGPVEGGVDAYVGRLRLTSRSEIKGGLYYRSSEEALVDPLAQIQGGIEREPSIFEGFYKDRLFHAILVGSKIAASLMNFLYSLVIGWILLKFYRDKLRRAYQVIDETPWKAVSVGILSALLLPIASLLLLMTILGIPFALTLIAANIIGFYTAKIFSVLWISQSIGKKIRLHSYPFSCFFVALIGYFALSMLPFIGFALEIGAMLVGMGASLIGTTSHKSSTSS